MPGCPQNTRQIRERGRDLAHSPSLHTLILSTTFLVTPPSAAGRRARCCSRIGVPGEVPHTPTCSHTASECCGIQAAEITTWLRIPTGACAEGQCHRTAFYQDGATALPIQAVQRSGRTSVS